MAEREDDRKNLLAEIERLRQRLHEAETTLDSIRNGKADAGVLPGPHDDRVQTFSGANRGYRLLLETMNEGAGILGSDGTIFLCNALLSEMLNTPMETMSGGSILDFTTTTDIPLMEDLLQRAMGEPLRMEICLRSPDGAMVPCHVSTSPFSVEESSAICMILTDLTQHRQVEQERGQSGESIRQLTDGRDELRVARHELERANTELSRTNHRLQALMDVLPVGICFSDDPSCDSITGNRCMLHQFGVMPDDNLSASGPDPAAFGRLLRWFRDGIEIGASELPLHRSAAEKKVIPPIELEVYAPDGRRFVIESSGSPIFDENGNVIGGIAVIVDVTQRKEIEDAVRASEKAYRDLAENIPGIVYRVHFDNGPTMEFFNETLESITGFKNEELKRGRVCSIDPLIVADDRSRVVELVEKACAENAPFEIEYRIRHKDGTIRHLVEYGRPILGTAGSPLMIDGVIFDITDRKRAEEELRKAHDELELRVKERTEELLLRNEELKRKNADLQQFSYVASHDLQEPLRNVTTCVEMLAGRYRDNIDSDADEYIRHAVESAARMKALILDLLAYSRIAAKEKPLQRIDCEAIVDQVVESLKPVVSETGAVITREPLPRIPADATLLSLVFRNLFENAIKFRRDESPRVHVSAVKEKNEWTFSVKDNGMGIESEYLDRIFVIFQRLHNRSEYGGTGIGLAVTKKIVEHHGGQIWAESQPGVGATFYFTIPERGRKGINSASDAR